MAQLMPSALSFERNVIEKEHSEEDAQTRQLQEILIEVTQETVVTKKKLGEQKLFKREILELKVVKLKVF